MAAHHNSPRRAVGLDFGTTNSALAVATAEGAPRMARFWSQAGPQLAYRSALYFEDDVRGAHLKPVCVTGPQAIELYLEGDGEGRFIQSAKTYLPSKSFRATRVGQHRYTLEALIATVVRDLRAEAEAQLGAVGGSVVAGRPVRLSKHEDEDDGYAVARLERALRLAGFDDVVLEFEPIAAAYHYERSLERDELVLIADFGGGTSDFTLIRVGPKARAARLANPDASAAHVLGSEGVPLAGNAFDSQIVRHAVAPALGLGTSYRTPFGRVLPIPASLYRDLQWHRLSMLHVGDLLDTLESIERTALVPERVEAFIHVIRYNLGYRLYQAVEKTKVELSQREASTFVFEDDDVRIERRVQRADFESWIAPELQAIEGCVDALFANTGVDYADVDCVFMTGGTSFVPAVHAIFTARFGPDRVRQGDALTSVAQGLALSARDRAVHA